MQNPSAASARVCVRSRGRPREALSTLRQLLAFAGHIRVFVAADELPEYTAVFGEQGLQSANMPFNIRHICLHMFAVDCVCLQSKLALPVFQVCCAILVAHDELCMQDCRCF